jgi:hypothetical protein
VTAGGALGYTAGTQHYVTSEADDYTQPTYDDKRTPAVEAIIGSSMVLGAGVYLWLRESDSASLLPSATLGVGTAAVLAGGALYLTHEGSHTQPAGSGLYQRQYYRDTAGFGISLGASGLVATGLGLWLWHSEAAGDAPTPNSKAPTVAPLVSFDRSHVSIGWAGAF